MQNFITASDYDASIHSEILDSITRQDAQIVEICEDRAVAEMKGYLSGRYDINDVFSATGANRHQLVLMMAIDIAIYHLFCISNPRMMSPIRKDRYDRAVQWLKDAQKGNFIIEGLPKVSAEAKEHSSQYLLRSDNKRNNHI